jgi:hypothetical protein
MASQYPDQLAQSEVTEGETKSVKESTPSDDDVKAFFNHAFAKADEARRPRENVWKQAWELYNGNYDWSAKASWQSKVNISLVRQAVDRAAATFRRALVRMRSFFGIEAESRVGYQQGLFTRTLLDYWLDRAHFISEFTTGLKVGLITSTIILKVWWEYCWVEDMSLVASEEKVEKQEYGITTGYETKQTVKPKRGKKLVGKLGLRAVDPFKFWIVPGSDGRFVIEETEALVADLEELAKQGIYEKAAVERLQPLVSGLNLEASEEAMRKGELASSKTGFLKTVKLYHYWGDIFDESGKVLMRDATFTVVGERGAVEVLRKPRTNPFYHGKAPYVTGTPYVVPFSTYNRGIVEDVAGVATMITELSNLIADGAMFDAIKAFEVDVDQLYSQAEAADGVYPGKTFRKSGLKLPVDKPLVRAIDVGKLPAEAINALSYFDSVFQKGTQITEFVSGHSSGSGKTATEIQTKTTQALEGLDDAARTVEETVIEPLLELTAKTIYQFHTDYTMPRLVENFPQAAMMLRDLSPAERYMLMGAPESFQFKARGISIMIDKSQSLEKVTQFMQLAGHVPGVLQRLNADYVLEEIVTGLGWNPQRALLQAAPPVQVMGPQGQSGGTPFPPSGTPTPAQAVAGELGAATGGAPGNPMANPLTPQGGDLLAQMMSQLGGQA